jgi:GH43 family beta-xylosidase
MSLTYRNPIWPGYFADPFVLRWDGAYYAYGTCEETTAARGAFLVLRSTDLVQWKPLGMALEPAPDAAPSAYWAPEVAAHDGKFYLYYSSAPKGRDELHRLRVAMADHPAGPFVDRGALLPESEGFCIDANPFRDPRDGKWYLFFAKDFFEERTGTGLAVVPLTADMTRAAAPSREVLRANADWQIYERDRWHYDRRWSAWHTVEGPCVVAHAGRYFCFYSGGNWQTPDYGVGYAEAEHPLGPWRHSPEFAPVVLRQRDGEVLGPGHNSYTVATDERTELLVYHAWDPARTARRMCIDRLIWTEAGPRCIGPTLDPQTIP